MEPGEVLGEALSVSKAQVPHCALLLGLIGKYLPPTLPLSAQLHVLIHVALVHEALAAELAGVPRLATVHSLLMSSELHLAVEHLATQCTPPIYLMELVVLGLLSRIQFGRDLGQL